MTPTPSQLPNWTGLLGWSTRFHDGTGPSQFTPMDAERRKWLEAALSSTSEGVEDPNKIMERAVQEIRSGKASVGLDLLDFTSDFPDCAENFGKVHAMECVIKLVESENPDVVKRALEVLALYLPNNPSLQAHASGIGCMESLRLTIKFHSGNEEVLVAAISAMGSLIRNAATLEADFIANEGIQYLGSLVAQAKSVRMKQKIISLLLFLSQGHDLSSHAGLFNGIIRDIYSTGDVEAANVQFWEIVSAFVAQVRLESATVTCVSARKSWLTRLDKDSQECHSIELSNLNGLVEWADAK